MNSLLQKFRNSGWIFLLIGVVALSACNNKKDGDSEKKQKSNDTGKKEVVENGKTESHSLKVLGHAPSFKLTDQNGSPFASEKLRGKPWVANFMFTRCKATCPKQAEELRKVQQELEKNRAGNFHLVSFTVDPENDTPEVLAKYAEQVGADGSSWSFLTGDAANVRDSISRKGFKLAVEIDADDPTVINHSPMFVLVDAYMRVRGLYDSGKENEVTELIAAFQKLEDEIVYVPAEIENPEWLETVKQKQLNAAKSLNAFHDFQFEDRRVQSGIQFRNKIVDDAGRTYKPVHYDHGTGIVVGDVDGDDLLDIYFVNQVGANGLWRNKGDGTFEDITDKAGVSVDDRISVSASFGDIDNDGDCDLYVTCVRKGNRLFENQGDGTFKDISAASETGHQGHSSGVVFVDFDRDGLLDMFVTNVGEYTQEKTTRATMESIRGEDPDKVYEFPIGHKDGFEGHLKPKRSETSILFRNLGGNKFKDVSKEMGLVDASWTGDATMIDINQDGWQDLYLLNMQGDDQCYLNKEGKAFEEVSRKYFPKTPWGSMGVKAFDFDNDDDLDLFLTDMHSDMSDHIGPDLEKFKANMKWPESMLQTDGRSIFGNAFFQNVNGGEKFEEVSDRIGAENYWPWGLSVDDLNADGFDDAFITSSMNFPFRYSVNALMLNEGGKKFFDCEFVLGVEPRKGTTIAPWFELDVNGADKNADVLDGIRSMYPEIKEFPDRTVIWSALGSRSSVIFDVDNDGDLDIVTNEMNEYPLVLISNLSEKNSDMSFIKVKLEGTSSNRSAFGAVVRVQTEKLKLMKVKDGQSGYMSHSDKPLYFGLDGADKVTQIEVTWPNGKKQVLEGPLDTRQTIIIKEE